MHTHTVSALINIARINWHDWCRTHNVASYKRTIESLKEARKLRGDIISTPTLAGRMPHR